MLLFLHVESEALLGFHGDQRPMPERKIRILGFSGSLRKHSYDRMALRTATGLTPDNAETEIFDLDGIPPFNQDLEEDILTG